MQNILSRLNAVTLTSPVVLRRATWGLVFTLLALLGYTTSGTAGWVLGSYLDSRFPALTAPVERPDTSGVRQRKPISAFEPVLSNNIFHARRSAAPGSNAVSTAPASAAPLKLTLSGVFISGEVAFAFVVGPDGRSEQVYKKGDCVPRVGDDEAKECTGGQGRLTRVQKDRIVVTFGGQPTVFLLEQGSDESPDASVANAAVAPRPVTVVPPGGQLPNTRSGNTISTRVPSAEVEKAFENFAEIVKQARVVPYSKDGVTTGFQIQNIAPGSVFQRLGLQNFDVIKGVNGESLTSADQALRLFTVFRNEKDVVLDIQRQEEQLKLAYVIE